jgi:hypothetical protein
MFSCKHKWEEVRRVHATPNVYDFKVERSSEDFMRETIFGVTSIELRCKLCGDVTERRLTGNHTKPL